MICWPRTQVARGLKRMRFDVSDASRIFVWSAMYGYLSNASFL